MPKSIPPTRLSSTSMSISRSRTARPADNAEGSA
jgi:hypothetical protein